jgi:two-component system sensor histidine kinase QseC
MAPSIRTFLLINLLLSVTLITSLAIVSNLFLAHNNIQNQLDLQLIRTSVQLKDILEATTRIKNISHLQKHIQHDIAPDIKPLIKSDHLRKAFFDYHSKFTYQVWKKNKELLLRSPNAPHISLNTHKMYLSTRWYKGERWRVFTAYNHKIQRYMMVSERENLRQKLENQLTQDSIIIMLLTYPFLGLLIWFVVGKGLGSLKKVAQEVSHRAATYLEPVDLSAVPTEIEPVIHELNGLFQRLQEAFEREKRFAADAAHELRTPLAALKIQTQVLLHSEAFEHNKAPLQKLVEGVDRATHVVQQLLTLSRMLPQEGLQDPESVNLTAVAREIMAYLVPSALERDIDLELRAPDDAAIVTGNNTMLGVLLRNLVDNAIRYSPLGSEVSIDIEDKSHKVILHVTDNGPGIAPELRDRVFERFYRVMGTKAMGTGLGLGIVRQIALLHHAKIDLNTPPSGQGLQVTISFPKQPAI